MKRGSTTECVLSCEDDEYYDWTDATNRECF